eukprot:TRINITY_DN15135_c0_g1_i1.p1 TRINITY_DN15135_c0_g1~~TRINITY_DN15135_c0_g1_i1.p1  ORF type:complete len:393 (-),score=49.82 TRINITY_DN15135_c0_g1_i1:20-1198(-)
MAETGHTGVAILGLGTANPEFAVKSDSYVDFVIDGLHIPTGGEIEKSLRRLGERTGIETRYFVTDDANKKRADWLDLPKEFPEKIPGMSWRNDLYCKNAPKLAIEASRKAVEDWGGNVADITHIVAVSCTGVMAPGVEFHVLEALGCRRTVQRLGINIMGCFGAFRGIATAKALARENPKNRVLLVCVEVCSVHFQAQMTLESFIGNALFADGSAAVVIGDAPQSTEHVLWTIEDTASLIIEATPDAMTWSASDTGFIMKLSSKIPDTLKTGAPEFARTLLGGRCETTECGWAVHPGGSAIIKGIETALELTPWQTKCSWDVLRDYGNMSSVTFLFLLAHLRKEPPKEQTSPWTVGMGFGPGLALEGVLLKNACHTDNSKQQQQQLPPLSAP